MTGNKAFGPPKGKSWTWVTRDVLSSAAWRSMAINTRRLVDFLMAEHMAQGGRDNGRLMVPRQQLEQRHRRPPCQRRHRRGCCAGLG